MAWISDPTLDEKGKKYRVYNEPYNNKPAGTRVYLPQDNPSTAPKGTFLRGQGQWDPSSGEWDQPLNGGNLMSLGVGGLLAAPVVAPLLGGLGAGSAASSAPAAGGGGILASSSIPVSMGMSGAGAVAPGAASGGSMLGGFGGILSKIFGKGGLDPTMLAMMGLSAFGGDDSGQERESFSGAGLADPKDALNRALSAVHRMGQGLGSRGPTKLRAVAPPPPEPVSIPGLGFQIGGGLGRDPALANPELLEGRSQESAMQFDPFQSIAQGEFDKAKGGQARRRNP